MRFVHVHTFNAMRGGSDVMFSTTVELLQAEGHAVETIERDAAGVDGLLAHLRADASSLHSGEAQREMRSLLRAFHPDVVHLHNLFPLLSPSVLEPCLKVGVPVVMTLDDHSLACPTGSLSRAGSVCTLCLGGHEYRCITTRCAGGYIASSAVALRTALARMRGVFHSGVDFFTTPSEALKAFYVEEGYPSERIAVLPNFVRTSAQISRRGAGDYVAYLGRISAEKGIFPLLQAAERSGVPTKIAGSGELPLRAADVSTNVTLVGTISGTAVDEFLARSRCVVVPSVGRESFSLSAAEAMMAGVPLIASSIGALPEIVPNEACIFVPPGDVDALSEAMKALWNDPDRAAAMGAAGRDHALRHYTKELFYDRLMALYRRLAPAAAAS